MSRTTNDTYFRDQRQQNRGSLPDGITTIEKCTTAASALKRAASPGSPAPVSVGIESELLGFGSPIFEGFRNDPASPYQFKSSYGADALDYIMREYEALHPPSEWEYEELDQTLVAPLDLPALAETVDRLIPRIEPEPLTPTPSFVSDAPINSETGGYKACTPLDVEAVARKLVHQDTPHPRQGFHFPSLCESEQMPASPELLCSQRNAGSYVKED